MRTQDFNARAKSWPRLTVQSEAHSSNKWKRKIKRIQAIGVIIIHELNVPDSCLIVFVPHLVRKRMKTLNQEGRRLIDKEEYTVIPTDNNS